MKLQFNPQRLDVRAFALACGQVEGSLPLVVLKRLAQDAPSMDHVQQVAWLARGEVRTGGDGQAQYWLHLDAAASVPLICQRCLAPVETSLLVERWFRFVADEATAQAQDDESEEDLLVMAGDFNLCELVEDELVLELPLIPRHEHCPVPPKLQAEDPEFAALSQAREKPFAALAGLKLPNRGKAG